MNNNIASKIRNFIFALTVSSFFLLVLLALWWGSGMMDRTGELHYDKFPRAIALSLTENFLQSNHTTLMSAAEHIVDQGEALGVAYVGLMNSQGIMFAREVSPHLPEDIRGNLMAERLAHRDDFIIKETEEFYLESEEEGEGYQIYEVVMPVEFRGEKPGALKIGIIPDNFIAGWSQFRNRMILAGAGLLGVAIFLLILASQRWRSQIDNSIKRAQNEVESKYEKKIQELENEIQSRPLETDEFFQVIDFGKKINRSMDPAEVLKYLVNSTVKILGVKQVVVFLISPENPDILRGQMGMKEGDWMDRNRLQNIEIEIGTGEVGTIAELGQSNIIDKPRPGAGVAAALRSEGQTIGVLRATEKRTGARMGNKDKLKVRLISQLSGNTIKHSFAFQQLQNK
ncbi:MAG: hypothetical protein ACQEP7_04045 [bacterium]